MAKKSKARTGAQKPKQGEAQTIEGAAEEVGAKKPSVSAPEFMRQVIREGRKVTWTTRQETQVSTLMVLVMVIIMAIFFFVVDQILRFGVCNLLPISCVAQG